MGIREVVLKSRFRKDGLAAVALGLGVALFVARYVLLGTLYLWLKLADPPMFVHMLVLRYLFPLDYAFTYPLVFWSVFGVSLALVAIALLWGHPHKAVRVALVLVALVIACTPLIYRYRPAVRAAGDVVLRVPTQPNFLWSAPKAFAAGAEIRRCDYALLGWDVDGALYYTETCGTRITQWHYFPQSDTCMQVATVPDDLLWQPSKRPTDRLNATMPGDDLLQISTRGPVLVSPDGEWQALIARHLYGPEDVVVVSSEIQ